MQKDMAAFLEGAWYVSVVDVESTLRHVCKKVRRGSAAARQRPCSERRRARVPLHMGGMPAH